MEAMSNAFEILTMFLDRTQSEVEGRSLEAPSEAIKLKLRNFISGTLSSVEQVELISELDQNPHWLSFLAQEVKALRQLNPRPKT
jgi:hypothetical protein